MYSQWYISIKVDHADLFNKRQKVILTIQVSVQRRSIPAVPRDHTICHRFQSSFHIQHFDHVTVPAEHTTFSYIHYNQRMVRGGFSQIRSTTTLRTLGTTYQNTLSPLRALITSKTRRSLERTPYQVQLQTTEERFLEATFRLRIVLHNYHYYEK